MDDSIGYCTFDDEYVISNTDNLFGLKGCQLLCQNIRPPTRDPYEIHNLSNLTKNPRVSKSHFFLI